MSITELVEPLLAIAMTGVGIFVELTASQWLLGGETIVGLWLMYMGGLALYAGLFVIGGGIVPDVPEPDAG